MPVTYRFHILLSDKWEILERDDYIEIVAPRLRPSLPPAPDISAAVIMTKNGPLKFGNEVRKGVEKQISPKLTTNAFQYASSNFVMNESQKSVEAFLISRFGALRDPSNTKRLMIRFRKQTDEENKQKG